jgi:pyridoxamine 5'-phosphate oxidase
MSSIADIRRDYKLQSLLENDIQKNPIDQFSIWWNQAIESQIDEVNAMTIATVDANHKPSARIVLLKDFDENGFVFFTNYNSAKAQELLAHPYAAITFLWHDLERQVRIEGAIEKVSAALSEEYFQSRPRKSQIGAWASPQSTVITDRAVLETEMERLDQEYAASEILPRPLHWGGYLVRPDLIEFWQGRRSRLHDRVQYRLENGQWVKELLAP